MLIIHIIMWHTLIKSRQLLVFRMRHHRIHEKATSVPFHSRIWKLVLTNPNNRAAQLVGRWLINPPPFQLRPYVSIRHVQLRFRRQEIFHSRNQVFVFPNGLELTLPVTVVAISRSNCHPLASGNVHRLYRSYELAHLRTIGPDILHHRSTHLARNQRQVHQVS